MCAMKAELIRKEGAQKRKRRPELGGVCSLVSVEADGSISIAGINSVKLAQQRRPDQHC